MNDARCINGEGSFTCECNTGVGDGVTSCSVASICNPNPCREPEEKCVVAGNTWQCDCADGFTHDSDGVCNNEDECSSGTDTCDKAGATPAICTDTIGSFTCACPIGYVMNTNDQCEGQGPTDYGEFEQFCPWTLIKILMNVFNFHLYVSLIPFAQILLAVLNVPVKWVSVVLRDPIPVLF